MASKSQLPKGWRLPTAQTLAQHAYGIEHGLVPAASLVLRVSADPVPQDEIDGRQARQTLARMHDVIEAMRATGRLIVGLAAPQVGEASQIILVPRHASYADDTYSDFMPVFNPSIEVDESSERTIVPHGCFSSNEVFARLPSATALTLSGLDIHGEPVSFDRTGLHAAVDEHEVRHLHGIRSADVAVGDGRQLDYRPPELAQSYREYFRERQSDPSVGEWPEGYSPEQWTAVRVGEFALENYYQQ